MIWLLRVSELDVGIDDTSEENLQKQAKYYGDLMKIFLRYADRIEAVQVWGTVDDLELARGQVPAPVRQGCPAEARV